MKSFTRYAAVSMLFFLLASPMTAFASDNLYHFEGTKQKFGSATSTEEKILETAQTQNHNRSKTAAYIPPEFGSSTSYTLYHLNRLTPNLVVESTVSDTTGIRQLDDAILESVPKQTGSTSGFWSETTSESWISSVTEALYYDAGHIGRLSIPALDVSVKVYEGASASNMKQGVAHMEESSIWSGNVVLCGHNRGASNYFSRLHTLEAGDTIRYQTKLGEKVYEVTGVQKIHETSQEALKPSDTDKLTLLTCVRNESAYRYMVTAIRVR